MIGRSRFVSVGAVAGLLALAACGTGGPADDTGRRLTIAVVDNGDLDRLREVSTAFTDAHPGVTLEWVREGENELRETVSTDVGTSGGRFDVVTIGTYEAEVWSGRKLLTPLTGMPEGFSPDAFIPTVREALSHEAQMLAAPFYAESSFTMYRTDLFEKAGLTMPERPTWEFINGAAATLGKPGDVDGICLRGKPG